MGQTNIIVRKDFLRIKKRVKRRIYNGLTRAEREEEKRIEHVVWRLQEKIDFYNWTDDPLKTEEVVCAIFQEWKELEISEIVRFFRLVVTVGILFSMQQQGEVEISRDSVGRKMFRTKK